MTSVEAWAVALNQWLHATDSGHDITCLLQRFAGGKVRGLTIFSVFTKCNLCDVEKLLTFPLSRV